GSARRRSATPGAEAPPRPAAAPRAAATGCPAPLTSAAAPTRSDPVGGRSAAASPRPRSRSEPAAMKVGVLASGSGTNLQALIDGAARGALGPATLAV